MDVMETKTAAGSRDRVSGFRDLLVHVEPNDDGEARLAVAVDLARRTGATLIGVGAEMVDPMVYNDGAGLAGGNLAALAQDLVLEDLARAEAMFKARTRDLPSKWLAYDGLPTETIAAVARGADLIIAGGGSPERKDDFRHANTSQLLLKAGRPILVVPPRAQRLFGNAVLIAWKDTREARRAVSDAMPFLRSAEVVLVVEICHKAEAGDAEFRTTAVADHLRRHDVEVASRVVVSTGDPAREIQTRAQTIGADLIVMGGYGHSRLGEWVFGGVTGDLLRHPEQFMLMSH